MAQACSVSFIRRGSRDSAPVLPRRTKKCAPMPHTNTTAAPPFAPRLRSRIVLRYNGIPDSRDILAVHVRWARVRYYFLHRRRHMRVPLSIRAVTDTLEDRNPVSPATDPAIPIGFGTLVNLNADLLHVGGQFN
ncbi:hypothetical protein BU25DRAFT_422805 [Macroventuria anomochaeta]|uniref:Uncharacterized protein n=1 Tax=Macroventuria anomochaeta TaxID=301207 RepID=A0ACB6RWH7_9PLEO|nr:uncharacterized protein BU25DRAFT_422805 [Macroventuria anomochaeta]KAF2626251.1 hypothetical protein BU25DRAFT_422805 [Macroventuria anomochaeta]